LTHPLDPAADSAFLSGILANFDVRGIHIHHNTWLYQRLPWLKAQRPDIPVVDSLHILEWRTGGFVDIAARLSNMIDVHHVISPALRDYLLGQQGLPPEKIKLATLANLTGTDIASVNRTRAADDPFTVAFVGRFTQQKRPYLFLQLAARLRKQAPGRVRFVMHGEGELGNEVQSLRVRYRLGDDLEVRGPEIPVARTLADADVLVISSDNEGLTLTSFEATAAGVPVVSTDVGSQASLVATDLLCPRHPYPFLHAAATSIATMMTSPDQRKKWLDEQIVKAAAFAKLPDARSWTRELYQGWACWTCRSASSTGTALTCCAIACCLFSSNRSACATRSSWWTTRPPTAPRRSSPATRIMIVSSCSGCRRTSAARAVSPPAWPGATNWARTSSGSWTTTATRTRTLWRSCGSAWPRPRSRWA